MDSVLKETKGAAQVTAVRRKRSAIPVPITLSGVDKHGQSFREDSRTLVIERHGMMVETIHRLNLGTEITVENPALERKSAGRVVWCGTEQSASQVNEIGIYLTDAEVMCGVELALEETEYRPPAKPEGPKSPPAGASSQPADAPISEHAPSQTAVQADLLVRKPEEGIKPLPYKAGEAHFQELDLTSEVGQMEAISRGTNTLPFRELDGLPKPSWGLTGPTEDTFVPPTIKPAASSETRLPLEQMNSAVEASLSLLEQRIGEIVPAQFGQFEQKLEVLAQQSLSLVQARLQESLSGLEPQIADLMERETASLGDRLQKAHAEVDALLTRLEQVPEQAPTSLPAIVAREEEEYAAQLELRMEGVLARHLVTAEDRLQHSRAEAESLLGRVEELRQKTQGNLQDWAARSITESSASLEQRIMAEVEQRLASLGDRLLNSRAEVEGLLTRLEEQRQRAEAGLQESASRLDGESAARLEKTITAALDQQLASAMDRLKGSHSDIQGVLNRLEEHRQRVEAYLQELAWRLEGESAARLEQRVTAVLDQQLASVVDRLQGPRAEVDGWLGRLDEVRQQAQKSLQDAFARLEADSGAWLERKITATLEPQLASAAERTQSERAGVERLLAHIEETGRQIQGRLQSSVVEVEEKVASFWREHLRVVEERLQSERLEAEGLRAQLERAGQEVRSNLQEAATRLEQESAARMEETMRLSLDQQMASVRDHLQSSPVEIEASLTRLQETQQQVHTSLEESATRLEQRMAESLGQQLITARECLQGALTEAESAVVRLEELRQKSHGAFQESLTMWEAESASRLEGRIVASLEQHVASEQDRLESARAELHGLLAKLEDSRESIQQSLQQSFIQVQGRIAAAVESQMASLGERLQGTRAEMEALLAGLEQSRQQAEVNLRESASRLQENATASLEQHATDTLKRFQTSRAEFESMMDGLEATRHQVHQELQGSAAQLEQRVSAFLDQQFGTAENRVAAVRADGGALLAKVEQLQQASEAEMAQARATLHELGSQTVQFTIEGVNERLESDGEQALAQFRSRSAEIVESECYALSQRVCSASNFLRDWSQQAAARLGSYSEGLEAKAAASAESRQKQSEQIATGFAERLQSDADLVLSEVLERVQQTAELLENTTVAAVQTRVQKGTQELVETTAAELRQLAQENLDLVSKQLAERQQQFTGEISAALHHTFDELVTASSAKVRKITEDSLDLITDQLATRQKMLIDDTTKALRQKVGEILVMLQNSSDESS